MRKNRVSVQDPVEAGSEKNWVKKINVLDVLRIFRRYEIC